MHIKEQAPLRVVTIAFLFILMLFKMHLQRKPIVSVLIPIYNVEKYLGNCLNSLRNQSLKAFEVIMIDDGSTDTSGDIAKSYILSDRRFKLFVHSHNLGTLSTRVDLIKRANAQYCCFLDPDDYLPHSDSLRTMVTLMKKNDVDILNFHFYAFVQNQHGEEKIELKYPYYHQRVEGQVRILETCFIDCKYGFTLWNKIYKTSLCRKAAEQMDEFRCNIAEDLYIYFVIAYHAESYLGVQTPALYAYRLGNGISTKHLDPHKAFMIFVNGEASSVRAVHTFIRRHNKEKVYSRFLAGLENRWYQMHIQRFISMPDEPCGEEFDLLCKYYSTIKTLLTLRSEYSNSPDKLWIKLSTSRTCRKLPLRIVSLLLFPI